MAAVGGGGSGGGGGTGGCDIGGSDDRDEKEGGMWHGASEHAMASEAEPR